MLPIRPMLLVGVAAVGAGCGLVAPSPTPVTVTVPPTELPRSMLPEQVASPTRQLEGVPTGQPTSTDAAAGAACRSEQLRLGQGERVSEPTGRITRLFTLTNASGQPCTLDGYPDVTYLDAAGKPLDFQVSRQGGMVITSAKPQPVTLAPGATSYLGTDHYRCDRGRVAEAARVRVVPPGADTALALTLPRSALIAYCGPGDPGSTLEISPVVATEQEIYQTH